MISSDIDNGSNKPCTLCPRLCGTDRSVKTGVCGCGEEIRIAKYMVHHGEEPCISGKRGSGAIFFSGCSLKCIYCQNYIISHQLKGENISSNRLEQIIYELIEKDVHNIEFITGTHFTDKIAAVLERVRKHTNITMIFNCGGYERVSTLKMLDGLIDVYLPDFKYISSDMSAMYSGAPDYAEKACLAIQEMARQAPVHKYDDEGMITKGVLIRHLVLPGGYKDSIEVLKKIKEMFPKNTPPVSIMRQYTPCFKAKDIKKLDRRLTTFEYNKVIDACIDMGIEGFMQEKGCESFEMRPEF